MNWYPFDKQVYSMKVAITEDLNEFIKLINNGHDNLGPTELTLYFIQHTDMYYSTTEDGRKAIFFEISLGRRLLGTILTVFIPTILLNIVKTIPRPSS